MRHGFRVLAVTVGLMIYVTIGCGGGGGGDGSVGAGSMGDLNLSHSAAAPGAFVTVEDESIQRNSEVNVTLQNDAGYGVVLTSAFTEEGRATFPVPPYLNPETGMFETGLVKISVPSGKQADFRIEALPELGTLAPGDVVRVYLQGVRDDYDYILTFLDDFAAAYEHPVDALKAAIQDEVWSVNLLLDELATFGTLGAYSTEGGSAILSQDELRIVDQLLYAMLKGAHDEIQRAATRPVRSAQESAEELEGLLHGGEQSEEVIKRSGDGIGKFFQYLSDFLSKTTGQDFGLTSDLINKGHKILSHGMMIDMLRSLKGNSYGPGLHTEAQIRKAVEESYDSYTPDELKRIIALTTEAWKALVKKRLEMCKADSSAFFCQEHEKYIDKTSYSYINRQRFIPSEVITGQPARLTYFIGGHTALGPHAQTNQVTIDWGDGNIDTYTKGQQIGRSIDAFLGDERSHTYVLADYNDMQYDAKITVQGDNDPDGAHAHTVTASILVKSETSALQVDFLEKEIALDIDETGTWRVEVSGGVPPFDIAMNWGDGRIQSREESYRRVYSGPHSYNAKNDYTIRFSVTDANDVSATGVTDVAVGVEFVDPVEDWGNWPNPEHCQSQANSSDQIHIDLTSNSYVKCDYRSGSDNYLYLETTFADGHRSGWQKTYGKISGTHYLMIQTPYNSNGDRHGIQKHFYENGVLLSETSYANGEQHGEDKTYNRDGSLDSCDIYAHGQLTGSCLP